MMFNNKHPELREEEVFFCNTANPEASQFGFRTKRVGNTAYDINGKKVNGLYPVFLNKSEKQDE